MFTYKKREGINRFVCDASLYVAKTPKASIKYHKPPLPIIPCGIVAYGFVGQPFSKQLYVKWLRDNLIGACRVSRVAGNLSWVAGKLSRVRNILKNIYISYFQ